MQTSLRVLVHFLIFDGKDMSLHKLLHPIS